METEWRMDLVDGWMDGFNGRMRLLRSDQPTQPPATTYCSDQAQAQAQGCTSAILHVPCLLYYICMVLLYYFILVFLFSCVLVLSCAVPSVC